MNICIMEEFPFNVSKVQVFIFSVQLLWSQPSYLSLKFLTFKVGPSLVLKSIVNQRNLKWGFHCMCFVDV